MKILQQTPDSQTIIAIKAVYNGEANEEQQRKAIDFIIKGICGTYNMSFHPDDARLTDFNEGRRFVGNKIIEILGLNVGKIQQLEKSKK